MRRDVEEIWAAADPLRSARDSADRPGPLALGTAARAARPPRRLPRWNPANAGYISPKLGSIDPITLAGRPIPERRWIVNGWVPHGQVTMLAGDGGVGKSLLAMLLATCCAIGRDWLGQPTTPCKVLGVFAEDDADELHRRQAAINEHLGVDFGDLEDLQWIPRIGEENALMHWERFEDAGEATELFQQVHNAASDFGAQLIVLDSLHDFFAGNENQRTHARQFVQLLASLARDRDGAVLLTAHPSLAGRNSGTGESGSTAWHNAVRSRLYLTQPAGEDGDVDRDARVLRRMKANYAGAGDEIRLAWRDGVFVAKIPATGILANIESRAFERAFLACLDAAAAQGRHVTDASNSPRYAPKVFIRMPERDGAAKKELERAMFGLFAAGTIKIGTAKGSDRHLVKAIVRVREVREAGV